MVAPPRPRTPEWPPRSAPRLFVAEELAEGVNVTLDGNQAHYLLRVMRVAEGDTIILCDNRTGEWAATVSEAAKRRIIVSVTGRLRDMEQVPDFWLCPALLKKDRFDLVLEKATELGVRAIHPLLMRRCVADKLNSARAQTIVTEAAEQCARTALPALGEVQTLAQMLAQWPEDRTLFFADETGGQAAAQQFASHSGPAALVTGPEGGFDPAERDLLMAHPQVKPITLGPRILRGETATIAATALWMGVAGDWAGPGGDISA